MATIDETLGQNVETEIESKEDAVSKQGGLNVNLDDFVESRVTE